LGSWLRFAVGNRLAPFVPTPIPVCRAMLRLARVGPQDRLADLGCGDGRILALAVNEFGARSAVGYEMDPSLAAMARANMRSEGVDNRVEVREQDACTADLSGCTVVTLYLTVSGNLQLVDLLAKLRPDARVVSFHWEFDGIEPIDTAKAGGTSLYLFDSASIARAAAASAPLSFQRHKASKRSR